MKIKTLIIFLLIAASSFAQKIPSPYPLYNVFSYTENYGYNKPTTDTFLSSYSYDSINRLHERKDFIKSGTAWQLRALESHTYDSGGRFMFTKTSSFNATNNQYTAISATQSKYDPTGQILYNLVGYYKGALLTIENINQYLYTATGQTAMSSTLDTIQKTGERHFYQYNTAGQVIQDSQLFWQKSRNAWGNEALEKWIKDIKGRDSIDFLQVWTATGWTNKQKNINYYDSNIHYGYSLTWNETSSKWDSIETLDSTIKNMNGWNVYLSFYDTSDHWKRYSQTVYSGTPKTYCFIPYYWNKNTSKYEERIDQTNECFNFDSQGRMLSDYSGQWGDYGYFDKEWRYDSLGRITYKGDEYFDYANRNWYYYYPKYTDIEASKTHFNDLHAYPNPTGDISTLSFTLENPDRWNIELLDISGKVVGTIEKEAYLWSGKHSYPINLKDLPPGLYYARIFSETKTEGVKILKQ